MPDFYRLDMPKEEINKTLLTAVLEAQPVVAGNFAVLTEDGQIQDSGISIEDFAPPMLSGLEYRTTERYNNKPVYVKLIAFGNLPNKATASVAHGVSNIDAFVSVAGSTSEGIFIPTMIYGGGFGDSSILEIKADRTNITIYAGGNRSGVTANILMRYTKTTD